MGIILFDGFCPTCNKWAKWITKRDRRGVFELVARDSEAGDEYLSICPARLKKLDSVLLFSQGVWFARSSVTCRVLWGLALHWRLAGLLLWLIPRPLRDLVYDVYARRRHRSNPADS